MSHYKYLQLALHPSSAVMPTNIFCCALHLNAPFPVLFLGCGLWSTQTASPGRALCLEGDVSARAGCFTFAGCMNQELSLSLESLGVAAQCRFLHSQTQPGTRQQRRQQQRVGLVRGPRGFELWECCVGACPTWCWGVGLEMHTSISGMHFVLLFFL